MKKIALLSCVTLLIVVSAFCIGKNSFKNPLHGKYKITQDYGKSIHPVKGNEYFHNGIDLSAARDTDVFSAASGTVIETGFDMEKGNYVIISHENGYESQYWHLKNYICNIGEKVTVKKAIGQLGATGVVTGPCLHFEISKDKTSIIPNDCIKFLK